MRSRKRELAEGAFTEIFCEIEMQASIGIRSDLCMYLRGRFHPMYTLIFSDFYFGGRSTQSEMASPSVLLH